MKLFRPSYVLHADKSGSTTWKSEASFEDIPGTCRTQYIDEDYDSNDDVGLPRTRTGNEARRRHISSARDRSLLCELIFFGRFPFHSNSNIFCFRVFLNREVGFASFRTHQHRLCQLSNWPQVQTLSRGTHITLHLHGCGLLYPSLLPTSWRIFNKE